MTTIWLLGDQLSHEHPALIKGDRAAATVLMIESKARGQALRYHQHKLVLIYSAMRHFAAELRKKGWRVDYYPLDRQLTFERALREHVKTTGSRAITMAEPHSFAETETVERLARRLRLPLTSVPGVQFLVSREEFRAWGRGQKRLLMERHYRRMRQQMGVLLDEDGEPAGGAWNFDAENRQTFAAWQRAGAPAARHEPIAAPDAITREVIALVEREFPDHPGRAADFWLPVDRRGALAWLRRFIRDRLPRFGAFEDMMASGQPFLFHSVLSPLINIGLLSPRECVDAALRAYQEGKAPINSVEGYVRQLIGWREFINGVYWLRGPEYKELNALDATRPLPGWVYTGDTPMNCLHQVLGQTLRFAWNHHIQRLMVLGNFFLLAGIRPQEALRWFSEMYVDAFDWVMAPNVIGMALHADAGYMATKPYAAGSGYIRRMSDYCRGCQFDPEEKTGPRACPFNYLYWDFVGRHARRFSRNPRMTQVVASWRKRSAADRAAGAASARRFLAEHVPA